jgi:EAL domain-containing protein (putative c-di-GMP-specific phosphodiesterase class I)
MASGENDAVIVRSTIDLAHNLGLRVVAEGVETKETWDMLARLRCDVAQGYYLSRPVPAADIPSWYGREPVTPAASNRKVVVGNGAVAAIAPDLVIQLENR